MEDLSRSEYPAMLVRSPTLHPGLTAARVELTVVYPRPQAHLQPSQATQVLVDRVKRINKINNEVADWLQVMTSGDMPPCDENWPDG